MGVGAPNRCKDGSSTQCAIGLSSEIGLFRVYPIKVGAGIKTWAECIVDASQNPKDSRIESWKVNSIEPTGLVVKEKDERAAILDSAVLYSGHNDPVDYQNEHRASIAIVRPDVEYGFISKGDLEAPPDYSESEDAWIYCQKESPYKPYVFWRSHTGKRHQSHLVAHEAYEWLRKEPTRPHCLFDNVALMNPDYLYWFVLGNMKDRRNVWVIVHIHRMKKPVNYFIGHYFAEKGGAKGAWPYSTQEAANVKRAEDPQMSLMFTTDDTSGIYTHGNMKIAI